MTPGAHHYVLRVCNRNVINKVSVLEYQTTSPQATDTRRRFGLGVGLLGVHHAVGIGTREVAGAGRKVELSKRRAAVDYWARGTH